MTPQEKARRLRPMIVKASAFLSDEDALLGAELFPRWSPDSYEYKVGDRVLYQETLFKCLTAHKSQPAWIPTDAPSVWVGVDNPAVEYPEWIQPLGATDAYASGAKVSHNGKHWISNADNNVWEPGVYGWNLVS